MIGRGTVYSATAPGGSVLSQLQRLKEKIAKLLGSANRRRSS